MTDETALCIMDLESEDISTDNTTNLCNKIGKDIATPPNDETELVLINPTDSILTQLALTPSDGCDLKEEFSDNNVGFDKAFQNKEDWNPELVQ